MASGGHRVAVPPDAADLKGAGRLQFGGHFGTRLGKSLEVCLAFQERVDHLGIEVTAAAFEDDGSGFFVRHGFFVGTTRAQGVVHVGDGDDAGGEGDAVAAPAVGVAAAVPFFVVAAGDFAGQLEEVVFAQLAADGFEAGVADGGVLFDLGPFLRGERAAFEQTVSETPTLPMSCRDEARARFSM